jgi:hypothetical protein
MIVASHRLYTFLTDRIGNFRELEPYLPFWGSVPYQAGVLEVVVFEHDAENAGSPLIPKMLDGMAGQARARRSKLDGSRGK